MSRFKSFVFTALSTLLILFSCCDAAEPDILWLRILDKPHEQMTISWIAPSSDDNDSVTYRKKGVSCWAKKEGERAAVPWNWINDLVVHHVTLDNLEADSDYEFVVSDGEIHSFRTLPHRFNKTIRFVAGGDVYGYSLDPLGDNLGYLKEINLQAASQDPMFIMFGGDLAYTAINVWRWLDWLRAAKEQLVTTDGRMIPLVVSLGNHDTLFFFGDNTEHAFIYYALFPTPDSQGYHVADIGDYMSLFVLDSGHTHTIGGQQASWLESSLQEREKRPLKYALYHVPAYPGARDPDSGKSEEIRESWVPSFEKFHLTAAFENHDHVYKRTCRIKNDREDSDGVLYLGDGCWSVKPREPNSKEEAWYLEKAVGERHFILAEIKQGKHKYRAITPSGKTIDEFVETGMNVGRFD